MRALFKIQYIVIFLCLGGAVWLTVKGLKSAQYTPEIANQAVSETDKISTLISAGDTSSLLELIKKMEDSGDLNDYPVISVIDAYKFLLQSDLLSVEQKVRYAQLKMDNAQGNEDIMIGVTTLLDVIKADSNNIAALEVLGERSIQSGQLEKARKRYEKLLSLQPQNKDYQEKLRFINGSLSK